MTTIITLLLDILVVIGALIAIIYFLAKNEKQFTFIPSGEIKFIVDGESLDEVIVNIRGKKYNYENDEIESHPDWKKKKLGIFLVSPLYPLRKIHVYRFDWDQLVKGQNANDYDIKHREEWVNSLYWRAPYPVFAQAVELKGNFKIDITGQFTIEVIKPAYLIFVLKGKWFAPFSAGIKSLMSDFARDKDIDDFTASSKSGKDSDFAKFFNGKLLLDGAVKIIETDFVQAESSGSLEEKNATTALKISQINAQTTVNAGEAEAKVVERMGVATAKAIKDKYDAVGSHPQGAKMFVAETIQNAVTGFKGKVLAMDTKPMISVSADDESANKKGEKVS